MLTFMQDERASEKTKTLLSFFHEVLIVPDKVWHALMMQLGFLKLMVG